MSNLLPERVPARPPALRRRELIRAAVSPSAVVVTAAGAGIGVADRSILVGVVLGAGAWLGRMAVAVAARWRRDRAAQPRPAQLDPYAVPEPWRQLLQQTLAVQTRFGHVVDDWPPGPIRDHLAGLQPRLWGEVATLGALARQGAAAQGWTGATMAGPSIEDLRAELRRVQARPGPLAAGTEQAVAAQLRARHRADQAATVLHDRLRTAVARLDGTLSELVTANQPSPNPTGLIDPTGLPVYTELLASTGVADALGGLSDELASLRAALGETTFQKGGGAPPDQVRS